MRACRRMNQMLLAALAAWCASATAHAAISSLDDITFWVGAGANRAGIVIDWNGQSQTDASLAWGYRWDGAATGEAMLRAVIAADPRLYAKLGDPNQFPFGIAVFGLGYDLNADNDFGITDPDAEFDADGVAVASPAIPPPDATSPTDVYREGWTAQRAWTYGVGVGNPWTTGHWQWSPQGSTQRVLQDGGWDSWAFNLTATTQPNIFAANPQPAVLLADADFDADGDVDGGDLLLWQRGLGATGAPTRMQGEATGDGAVTALDLDAWQAEFGFGAALVASSAAPEPATSILCGVCASAMFVRRRSLERISKPSFPWERVGT